MSGFFVTFEGIEGSGKTSQIMGLLDYLAKKNIDYKATREPGGTKLGGQIRNVLLSHTEEVFPPIAELLLYEADRNIHLHNIIKPALNKDRVVVCDRFFDSTLVYQGYARGLDKELIKMLNLLATEDLQPDLTFILDIPVGVSMNRMSGQMDRIEKENIEFHQKLRDGYLDIARNNPKRFVIIDASKSEAVVLRDILREFEKRFGGQL